MKATIKKYNIINGKKYFNWSCVGYLLINMETKADNVKGKDLKIAAKDVSYASSHYINTGRAGTDWIEAWASADPNKLFKYVKNTYDGSIKSAIQQITEYLKKYCQLPE